MAAESKPTTDNNNFTDLIVEQLLEIHNRWGNAVFETLTRPWQKKIPS